MIKTMKAQLIQVGIFIYGVVFKEGIVVDVFNFVLQNYKNYSNTCDQVLLSMIAVHNDINVKSSVPTSGIT